jgi:hypothetical protein
MEQFFLPSRLQSSSELTVILHLDSPLLFLIWGSKRFSCFLGESMVVEWYIIGLRTDRIGCTRSGVNLTGKKCDML